MANDAQSKITLAVETTADTAALTATAAAMDKVAASTKQATAGVDAWTSATANKTPVVHANPGASAWTSATGMNATAISELSRAHYDLDAAQKQVTRTANGVAEAKDKVSRSSRNAGQSLMIFGQMSQDAQYGMAALSNQVGQLAQSLNLGAGLAGAITIAAVGFELLFKHTDIFGSKAREAAEKANKLEEATAEAATKAHEFADAMNAAEEAGAKFEERLRTIESAYKDQIKAINQATEARHLEEKGIQRMAEAATANALADIDKDQATGKITASEAEKRRRAIKKEHDGDSFRRSDDSRDKDADAESQKANEAAKIARDKAAEAEALKRRGEGLLDEHTRKSLEEEEKKRKAALENRKRELEELPDLDNYDPTTGEGYNVPPGETPDVEKAREEGRQKIAEEQAELDRVQEQIRRDKEAQARVGDKIPDKKVLDERTKELQREAAEAAKEAEDQRRKADQITRQRQYDNAVFPEEQRAQDTQSEARIEAAKAQEKRAAEAEAKRKEAEAKRERDKAERAAEKTVDAARDAGVRPEKVRELKKAAEGALKGDAIAAAQLDELLALLEKHLPKANDKAEKLQKRIDELEAAVKQLREGH